jgi:hypothetical protein
MNAFSVGPEPYPGYDAEVAVRFALSCLQCPDPAPCVSHCQQGADIPGVMRWIGQTGCAGFSLMNWARLQDEAAASQTAGELCAAYNS